MSSTSFLPTPFIHDFLLRVHENIQDFEKYFPIGFVKHKMSIEYRLYHKSGKIFLIDIEESPLWRKNDYHNYLHKHNRKT